MRAARLDGEGTLPLLTYQWIEKVGRTTDTDLRGHRVALTYHFFARDLDEHINGDQSVWSRLEREKQIKRVNATWFNFATWATVTINRDLGLGQTPAGVNRLLRGPQRRSLTPLLLHLTAADGQRVSRALSWGQRLVFLSTTRIWLARREGGQSDMSGSKTEIFDSIREEAGWDDQMLGNTRHLHVIWSAFDAYLEAAKASREMRDADKESRTRLAAYASCCILEANILITAVEQDIVDEAVSETINHIPELFKSTVIARAARLGDRYLDVPRQMTALNLAFQGEDAFKALRAAWARFMTDQILVLLLPTETLRLGKDLPPLSITGPYFPCELTDLTEQGASSNLAGLVESFDRTRGEGRGSGAHDWRSYDDRMNWAVTLLRSRQQALSLYWCPYSQQDQWRIFRGDLPRRNGDPTNYEVLAPLEGFTASGARDDQ